MQEKRVQYLCVLTKLKQRIPTTLFWTKVNKRLECIYFFCLKLMPVFLTILNAYHFTFVKMLNLENFILYQIYITIERSYFPFLYSYITVNMYFNWSYQNLWQNLVFQINIMIKQFFSEDQWPRLRIKKFFLSFFLYSFWITKY